MFGKTILSTLSASLLCLHVSLRHGLESPWRCLLCSDDNAVVATLAMAADAVQWRSSTRKEDLQLLYRALIAVSRLIYRLKYRLKYRLYFLYSGLPPPWIIQPPLCCSVSSEIPANWFGRFLWRLLSWLFSLALAWDRSLSGTCCPATRLLVCPLMLLFTSFSACFDIAPRRLSVVWS